LTTITGTATNALHITNCGNLLQIDAFFYLTSVAGGILIENNGDIRSVMRTA